MRAFKAVIYLAIVLLSLLWTNAWSQSETRISGAFQNTPFIQFVEEIERRTDHRFFFNPAWIDSLVVTVNLTNNTLEETLAVVLKETDIKYAITPTHVVYLTKREALVMHLPADFFDTRITSDSAKKNSSYVRFEESEEVKAEKPIVIGIKNANSRATASIAGYVRNSKSGEPVIGATIMIDAPLIGVATDPSGYYSITLPKGA